MILRAGPAGDLETRRAFDGSAILAGRFPYGARADFGNGRQETFAPGAFTESIREGDVHLLHGHDFNRPLARRSSETLDLSEDGGALSFEARIPADVAKIGFVADALAAVEVGLIAGLSPGFRLERAADQSITRDGGTTLRTIRRARLVELSLVTRAAYPDAEVQARDWQGVPEALRGKALILHRWRA